MLDQEPPPGAVVRGVLVAVAVLGFLPWLFASASAIRAQDEFTQRVHLFSRASRWRNLVRKVEVLTPGPLREGSQLLVTFDVMGKIRTATSDVWAYEPPRRFGLKNTASNVTGVFEYTLEPQGGGTLVRFTCDILPHGVMWLVLPFLFRGNRMRYRDQLANLKRAIEETPPA